MINEEEKVLAAYESMQQAMIDKDIDKLDRIIKDGTTFTHMSGKTQTKEEYFGEIADGTLNYYKYKIADCKIAVNGDTATLTANVTLTAKVYGMSGSWTLPVNAHFEKINNEAIIDKETWDIVHKVREGRIRKTRMGEINKYSGLIYCADCGRKHYLYRGRTVKRESYSFICGNYHKHVGIEKCTPHSIREVVLDEIVLEEINRAIYYARNNTKEFTDYISKKTSSQYRKDLNAKTAELSKAEKRIIELKSLFKRLYEDNVLGRISDEQYRMLSLDYNDEQKELEQSIPDSQKEIDTLKSECTNVQKFLDIVRKYVHVEELTPEVRTFISKIVVHEREKKHSQTSSQQINIYFRYIGTFALPSITDVTEETEQDERRTA